jgi:5-methylthioribose kinase
VPEVYLWDETMAVIAMQYVESPHVILRGALVAGRCAHLRVHRALPRTQPDRVRGARRTFPVLAEHMAEFLASTLFNTSALALRGAAFRLAIAQYANVNMCELTEQVVFTDPFYCSPVNSHTSPQLDKDAVALRCDVAAKAAATSLKRTFMESAQALLHGDLHTGSVMVTDTSTFVIDCEFAFYGPMGFDVGAILGNLLLAFFASDGCVRGARAVPCVSLALTFHACRRHGEDRSAQRAWLLSCIQDIWQLFAAKFKKRWTDAVAQGRAGEACPSVRHCGCM